VRVLGEIRSPSRAVTASPDRQLTLNLAAGLPRYIAGGERSTRRYRLLRKEDHQAFIRAFVFDIKDGKHRILETIPKEETFFPPGCKLA
jgi:hypothetical protein